MTEIEALRAERDKLHESLHDTVTVTVRQLRAELDAAQARVKSLEESLRGTTTEWVWTLKLLEAANAENAGLREALGMVVRELEDPLQIEFTRSELLAKARAALAESEGAP